MKKLLFIALLIVSLLCTSLALVACDDEGTVVLDAPVVTLTDNVISWTAVDNATSYDIYRNSTSVTVQTGTSYTITDTAEGSYSYYVIAKATIEDVAITSAKSNVVTYVVTASSGGDDPEVDASAWTLSSLLEDDTYGFVFNATTTANYDTNMSMAVTDHDGDTNNTLVLTITNTGSKDIFAKGKVEFDGCTDQTAKYGEMTIAVGETVTVYIDVAGIDATKIFIFPDLGEQEVAGEASFTIDKCEFANITTLAKPVIALDTDVISWTAVEGAEGYDIYCNGEFVVSQTEVSYTVTDTVEGIYKYTVVATSTVDGYVDSSASNEVSYIVGEPTLPDVSLGTWSTDDTAELVIDATGDKVAVTYTGVSAESYKNMYSALSDYNSLYTTVVVTISNTSESAMTMRVGLDDGGTDYGNYDNCTIVVEGNSTAVFAITIRNTLYTPTSIKLYPDSAETSSKSAGSFTIDSVVFYTDDTAPVAISAPVLELDGNEVKWTAVDNATSYSIYCNGEFVVNQENTSYVIDKSADGIYSYTVVACTTTAGYLDSAASTAVKYTIGDVAAVDPSLTIEYPSTVTVADGVYTHTFTATEDKTWDNTIGIIVNDLDVATYNRVKITYTNTGDTDVIVGTKIAVSSSSEDVGYGGDATLVAGASEIIYINIDIASLGYMQIFPDYGTTAGEATITFAVEFYYDEPTTDPTDPDAGDTTAQPTLGDWWVDNSGAIVVDETLGFTFTATETENDYSMCLGVSVATYDSADFNRAMITITNTGSTAIYISANAELLDVDYSQLAVAYGDIAVPVGETVTMYINLEDVTSGDVFVVSQFVLFPNIGTTAGEASFTVDSLSFYYDEPTTTDPTDPTDPVDPDATSGPTLGDWSNGYDSEDGFTFTADGGTDTDANDTSWNINFESVISGHDADEYNTITLTFSNTGDTTVGIKVKAYSSTNSDGVFGNSFETLVLAAGETGVVVVTVDFDVEYIMVFTNFGSATGSATVVVNSVVFTLPVALDAPVVSIDGDTISWDAVDYADGYNIFLDGNWVDNISDTTYTVTTEGTYTVVAQDYGDGYTDSASSNGVEYTIPVVATPAITSVAGYDASAVDGESYANDGKYEVEASISGQDITITITVNGELVYVDGSAQVVFGVKLFDNGIMLDDKVAATAPQSSVIAYYPDTTSGCALTALNAATFTGENTYTITYNEVDYTVTIVLVCDDEFIPTDVISSVKSYTRFDLYNNYKGDADADKYEVEASISGDVITVTITVTEALSASTEYLSWGVYLYDGAKLLKDTEVAGAIAYDPTATSEWSSELSWFSVDLESKSYTITYNLTGDTYTVNVVLVEAFAD